MVSKLKEWQEWATAAEQGALARAAGTSVAYLFKQLAYGYREANAALAGRIEMAAKSLRTASDGRLPEITRMDLCSACAECPYARACRETSAAAAVVKDQDPSHSLV